MPAHSLGPHVVGQRVVIRRIVPGESGPTGGPAFTDLLGVCTAWGPAEAVIATEGGPVVVPIALIVSGKPVPPRPSVRLRVSVRDAELLTARLWPGVVTEPLGEWQLRLETRPEGRPLKRANSALAVGDPGAIGVPDALARVAAYYASHDRRPLLQVEADEPIEAAAQAAGWVSLGRGDAAFLLAPTAQLTRTLRDRGALRSPGDGDAPRLSIEDGRAVAQILDAHGIRIASGSAALDGDWLAIHDLAVDEAHRRRGLAQTVLAELVEWGAEQGARTAWLHVELDNGPARRLYDTLGFIEHHRNRYLTLPDPGDHPDPGDPTAASRS